ncbi:hypothetical protein F5Y16DRAFT_376790 [Xylariaceae sp. FL0255]|nr:hypothetical protein F5Y16DRAFT_376790 [Xylariaceae sp. FL0255]
MDEEIARLRALLAKEQGLREEADRKREEEQRRREEEQRRRESAERRAEGSQPQTLQQYLEACHSLSLAIQVETDRSSTTQGEPTNPTGRIFPRRILPWDDYPTQQEKIWSLLDGLPLCSDALFPSSHQLDYVAAFNKPITSETDLRHFARETVENAVQKLCDAAFEDSQLRARLDVQGSITFENHTNLGDNIKDISASIEQLAITQNNISTATPAPRRSRKAKRGKSGPADQFCVYRKSNGQNIPALAIEYKAPHKLTRDEVVAGLRGEIQPARDVINQDGEGFAFASRALVAAVITQLFAYMVDKGIRYGYVYTGETLVFLRIPDDPSVVYYYVCVPNLDVFEDDEDWLHHTAVAQVFAFVLQALRARPLPQTWHDHAKSLDTWAVEFEDVLRNTPETDRKPTKKSPLYKAQRWRNFKRSPIKTRSRCQQGGSNPGPREKRDSDDDDGPPSPSASRSLRTSTKVASAASTTVRNVKPGRRGGGSLAGGKREQTQRPAHMSIQDRPFCTAKCLLGLANGGPLDKQCPNFGDHQRQHISVSEFQRLVRLQLANDRGPDADAMPLYLSGSVGALFKVCLSTHGYTLVAKGVEEDYFDRLQHEKQVYSQLRTIQGQHVPVCLGLVDLVLPYYYDGGVFVHFLFLSWAGRPLFDMSRQVSKDAVTTAVSTAFTAVHRLKVLHCDAEPRNVLYNAQNSHIMIVDFERAKLFDRKPLGLISPNRKRKHTYSSEKQNRDDFTKELLCILSSIQRYVK